MHQKCSRSCLLYLGLVASSVACGSPPPPQVAVSDSNYQEVSDAPREAPASPHDLGAPPVASPDDAPSLETKWWTREPPCPEGATLYGGPPPEHHEVGCKTDKGVNSGMYTRFHPSGTKAEEGEYAKHVAIGTWVQWNDGGIKMLETQYDKGARDGVETEWFPDGKIKTQRHYVRGKREGLTTLWDSDGNKRSAIEYRAGEQAGPATYWDATGKVARVEHWEAGKRVK